MVEWLFKNPIGDGGQFTGVSDILTKYGVVPAEVMVETNSSNSTGRMSNLIGLKLKEYGLQLRDLSTTKGTTGSGEKEDRDARYDLPYARIELGRAAYEIHVDSQRR